jgi:hypothetical protein
MLFHRREATKSMKKLGSLVLFSAALSLALPTLASAHDYGRHWNGHGHRGHVRAFAPFPVPIPVPVPIVRSYSPVYAPGYGAPCPPPAYYPAPTYYSAPAPFIAVRTPRVAVSIGGYFPY